jgi:hypothetical protein
MPRKNAEPILHSVFWEMDVFMLRIVVGFLIRLIRDFKKVAWRKCFFALDAWKFHHGYTSESFHRILAGLTSSPMQTQCQQKSGAAIVALMLFDKWIIFQFAPRYSGHL